MKRIYELLLPPFAVSSLIWIILSTCLPFKSYNQSNISWQVLGMILIIVTITLIVIIFKDKKNIKLDQ